MIKKIKKKVTNIFNRSQFQGSIDSLVGNRIEGWVKKLNNNEPITFKLLKGSGEVLAQGVADKRREDLSDLGYGDCAFSVIFNKTKLNVGERLVLYVEDTLIDDYKVSVENVANPFTTAGLSGFIDSADTLKIDGWAYSNIGNQESLKVTVIDEDNRLIAEGVANLFRADLAKPESNFGKCGFSLEVIEYYDLTKRLILCDDKGNYINEYVPSKEIAQADSEVIGKIESVSDIGITGWVYVSQSSKNPNEIRLIDDKNNLLAETEAIRPKVVLVENESIKVSGFDVYLNTPIPIDTKIIKLVVGEEIIYEYTIDHITDGVDKLILSGRYYEAFDYSRDNYYEHKEYKNILYHIIKRAYEAKNFIELGNIFVSLRRSVEHDIFGSIVADALIQFSLLNTDELESEKLFIERVFDLVNNYANQSENVTINRTIKLTSDQKVALVTSLLYLRRQNADQLLTQLNNIFFSGAIDSSLIADYELCYGFIEELPLLPSKDESVTQILQKYHKTVEKLNNPIGYSAKFYTLNYLIVCLSSGNSRNELIQNKDIILEFIDSCLDQFEVKAKSFLLDFYVSLGKLKEILPVFKELMNLDHNMVTWSSRFIDNYIHEAFDLFSTKDKKKILLFLNHKLKIERISPMGLAILAGIYIEKSKDQDNLKNISRIFPLMIDYSWHQSVRIQIDQLLRLELFNPFMLKQSKPYLAYNELVEFNSNPVMSFEEELILSSRLLRDFWSKMLSNKLYDPPEHLSIEKKGKTLSVGIILTESLEKNERYFNYLSNCAALYGLKITSGSDTDAQLILKNDSSIFSGKVFELFQNECDLRVINESHTILAEITFKNSSDRSCTLVSEDKILLKSKDQLKYFTDNMGVLHSDDVTGAADFYANVLSKNLTPKVLNFGKDILFATKADFNKMKSSELVCFIVQRNESARLPKCFELYRKLGVDRFVVVDNFSDDNTLDILLDQADVDVFSSPQPYSSSKYGVDWIDLLVRLFRQDKWCLVIDPDEELFLYEHDSIKGLMTSMLENNEDALYTPFIDVYPEGSFNDHPVEMKLLSNVKFFYDKKWYTINTTNGGYYNHLPTFHGGVRFRKFGLSSVVLNKVPLFKFHRGMTLREGVHWLDECNPAYDRAALLHHKYNTLFHKYVLRESKRGEHWNGAVEYKRYLEEIGKDEGLQLYDSNVSAEFNRNTKL
ncbi:MAG: glycosyltransferase family 2 protein [Fulvivirga sp.]